MIIYRAKVPKTPPQPCPNKDVQNFKNSNWFWTIDSGLNDKEDKAAELCCGATMNFMTWSLLCLSYVPQESFAIHVLEENPEGSGSLILPSKAP